MSLAGRVAMVTGSGRNIGRPTVLELAARGADVVINARTNIMEAESVAKEAQGVGVRAMALMADVADQPQVDRMISEAAAQLGPIDILVDNAGLRKVPPISKLSVEESREVVGVNMDGPFYLCKAVVPNMIERGWGRIINVSGLNAFNGRAEWAHVCASKMGALGLTQALAVELAPHGILVNHIVPGAFDTLREGSERPTAPLRPTPGIPLGRLGLPEEIAKACVFLAPENASFITGQTIHGNGGALAG